MTIKSCCVVGSGEMFGAPRDCDLLIAADGGLNHMRALGLTPDVIIGDFDSLGHVPDHPCVVRLSPIKDVTDMAAAIDYAVQRGCTELHLYGGTGGRLSHTLANIGCLADMAARGLRGYLYGNGEILTAVKDGALHFDESARGFLSVFALSGTCEGVYESGLKYSLHDYTMRPDTPIGVSNEFVGQKSTVSVRVGTLLVVYSEHASQPTRA